MYKRGDQEREGTPKKYIYIYIYTHTHIYTYIIYSMFLTTHLLPTTFPGSRNFTSIISLYPHKEPMR